LLTAKASPNRRGADEGGGEVNGLNFITDLWLITCICWINFTKNGNDDNEVIKMIGYRNPVALVRKLIISVRGLQIEEEWRVYLVVACLSVVCSALILLHVVFGQTEREVISQGSGQHVKLQIDQTLFQQRVPEKNAVVKETVASASAPATKQAEVKKRSPQERVENGEWYFDEIHKEWRFKKK
jgi:hypothetical protein